MKKKEIEKYFSASLNNGVILEFEFFNSSINLFGRLIDWKNDNWRVTKENKWRILQVDRMATYEMGNDISLTQVIDGDTIKDIFSLLTANVINLRYFNDQRI